MGEESSPSMAFYIKEFVAKSDAHAAAFKCVYLCECVMHALAGECAVFGGFFSPIQIGGGGPRWFAYYTPNTVTYLMEVGDIIWLSLYQYQFNIKRDRTGTHFFFRAKTLRLCRLVCLECASKRYKVIGTATEKIRWLIRYTQKYGIRFSYPQRQRDIRRFSEENTRFEEIRKTKKTKYDGSCCPKMYFRFVTVSNVWLFGKESLVNHIVSFFFNFLPLRRVQRVKKSLNLKTKQ